MEQKIKALKASSKIISVIAKICYTVMIVGICICATMLIFMAFTGGKISEFTIGGTNIIFFDKIASTPAELSAICNMLIVVSGFCLAIFLLTYRMFHDISLTGDPFTGKHVKTVRAIGILTAAMPVALGIFECVITAFSKTEIPEMVSDVPGVAIGAVIFCLSYIIDYGCGLKKQSDADVKESVK